MLGDGNLDVAAAGTAEPLSDVSVQIWSVVVQANGDNTGDIYVGGETIAAGRGVLLAAGESIKLTVEDGVTDLQHVWVDAETSTEGVTFVYGIPS